MSNVLKAKGELDLLSRAATSDGRRSAGELDQVQDWLKRLN
jgi:hypothetical protein